MIINNPSNIDKKKIEYNENLIEQKFEPLIIYIKSLRIENQRAVFTELISSLKNRLLIYQKKLKETRDSLNKNKENFFDVLKEMNGFMEKTKLLFFEKKDKLIEKLIDKNSSNKNPSNFFNNEDLTKLIACFSKIPKSKQLTKNRKLEIHSFESKNEEDDYKKMNNFKETKNTAKFFSNYINPSNNLKDIIKKLVPSIRRLHLLKYLDEKEFLTYQKEYQKKKQLITWYIEKHKKFPDFKENDEFEIEFKKLNRLSIWKKIYCLNSLKVLRCDSETYRFRLKNEYEKAIDEGMIKEDEKPKAKRMFDYLNEKFDYQKEYLVQPKDAKMFNENSELIFKKLQK